MQCTAPMPKKKSLTEVMNFRNNWWQQFLVIL